MKKIFCRAASILLIGAIATTTLGTTVFAAMPPASAPSEVAEIVIPEIDATTVANLDKAVDEFIQTYGKENVNTVISSALGAQSVAEERGITSTAKAIAKVLRQFGDDIIRAIRKVPGVGKVVGDFLEKHLGSLVDIMETIEGGAEGAIIYICHDIFGCSQQTSETIASVIVAVAEIFL